MQAKALAKGKRATRWGTRNSLSYSPLSIIKIQRHVTLMLFLVVSNQKSLPLDFEQYWYS